MYQYYNAHPKGLHVGDCVKRAITVATKMDYMEVQRELNRHKKITGARSFNCDHNPHHYVETVLHAKKLSFPAVKGQERMNGRQFCKSYPHGRYILNMAGHWSCCVDGIIYDTWDCSDKCVYTAYEVHAVTSQKCVLKSCYTIRTLSTNESVITIYDGNGKSVDKVMDTSIAQGYTKCLEDFGYIHMWS